MMADVSRSIYRYQIPVNDQAHTIRLTGTPVHVAALDARPGSLVEAVEFWAEHYPDAPYADRVFQVFGTGHAIPENAVWIGTADRTPNGFVWHLYEIVQVDWPDEPPAAFSDALRAVGGADE